MPAKTLTRQNFDIRLQLFILRGCTNQLGFVPDILKTVEKYKLTDYLRSYMSFSSFPSKFIWRNIINRNARQFHESAWLKQINHNNEFGRFVTLHPVLKMSAILEIAADSKTLSTAFLIAKIWAKTNQNKDSPEYAWCGELTSDPFKHLVTLCQHNFVQRATFVNFVKDNVSAEIGCVLQNSDFETFYAYYSVRIVIIPLTPGIASTYIFLLRQLRS